MMHCISSGTVAPSKPFSCAASVRVSPKTMKNLLSLQLTFAAPALLQCLQGRREPKEVLLRPTVCQGGRQDLCWDPTHLEPSNVRAETSTASVASPLWLENHIKFNLCPLPLKGFALQVPLLWEMLGLCVLTIPRQVQEPYITSAPEHPSRND